VKVSSPIGDLPFTPTSVRVSRSGVDIDGAMGAWPAHVHIDPSDLPALALLLPLRELSLAVAAGLLVARGLRRRSDTSRRRTRHVRCS
jgi:hypothetical protein